MAGRGAPQAAGTTGAGNGSVPSSGSQQPADGDGRHGRGGGRGGGGRSFGSRPQQLNMPARTEPVGSATSAPRPARSTRTARAPELLTPPAATGESPAPTANAWSKPLPTGGGSHQGEGVKAKDGQVSAAEQAASGAEKQGRRTADSAAAAGEATATSTAKTHPAKQVKAGTAKQAGSAGDLQKKGQGKAGTAKQAGSAGDLETTGQGKAGTAKQAGSAGDRKKNSAAKRAGLIRELSRLIANRDKALTANRCQMTVTKDDELRETESRAQECAKALASLSPEKMQTGMSVTLTTGSENAGRIYLVRRAAGEEIHLRSADGRWTAVTTQVSGVKEATQAQMQMTLLQLSTVSVPTEIDCRRLMLNQLQRRGEQVLEEYAEYATDNPRGLGRHLPEGTEWVRTSSGVFTSVTSRMHRAQYDETKQWHVRATEEVYDTAVTKLLPMLMDGDDTGRSIPADEQRRAPI